VPTIAYFYGIHIRMFVNDHQPPHFHAIYGEFEANIDIATGKIIKGKLPRQPSVSSRSGRLCIGRN